MAYVVAEFDDGVAAVHSSWFTPRKHEVFWPPYKEQKQFDKALQIGEPVDSTTWRLYSVSRIFYESDDLLKTRLKLKQSQVNSNLESEEEEYSRRKLRKRTTRIINSDSSADDDEDAQLPRPPPVKKSNFKKKSFDNQFQNGDNELHSLTGADGLEIPTGCSTPKVHLDDGSSQIFAGCSTPKVHLDGSSQISVTSTPRSSTHNLNLYGSQAKSTGLTNEIAALISAVSRVEEQNNQILAWIKNQANPNIVIQGLPDLPVGLPLQTVEEVTQLDNHLKQSDNDVTKLCSYLSNLGGSTVSGKTNRIFKYILADTAAINFNYFGKRSQKRAFSNLLLKNIILRAVKSSLPNSTDKEIEDSIKVWLKHAPDRIRIRNNKQNGGEH